MRCYICADCMTEGMRAENGWTICALCFRDHPAVSVLWRCAPWELGAGEKKHKS